MAGWKYIEYSGGWDSSITEGGESTPVCILKKLRGYVEYLEGGGGTIQSLKGLRAPLVKAITAQNPEVIPPNGKIPNDSFTNFEISSIVHPNVEITKFVSPNIDLPNGLSAGKNRISRFFFY